MELIPSQTTPKQCIGTTAFCSLFLHKNKNHSLQTWCLYVCVCDGVCVWLGSIQTFYNLRIRIGLSQPKRPGSCGVNPNRLGWELSGWPSMFGWFRLLHRFGNFFGQRFCDLSWNWLKWLHIVLRNFIVLSALSNDILTHKLWLDWNYYDYMGVLGSVQLKLKMTRRSHFNRNTK